MSAASRGRRRAAARVTALAGLLAALGVAGCWLAVSGGGPARTPEGRAVTSALFFLLGGAAMGGLRPRGRGWWLAALVAAGPAVLGATGLGLWLAEPGRSGAGLALLYLAGPAALSLAGARVAAELRRRARPERDPTTWASRAAEARR